MFGNAQSKFYNIELPTVSFFFNIEGYNDLYVAVVVYRYLHSNTTSRDAEDRAPPYIRAYRKNDVAQQVVKSEE